MKRQFFTRAVLASACTLALSAAANTVAADECAAVKGKIRNTSHSPALGSVGPVPVVNPVTGATEYQMVGGVTTLGVASLNGGDTFGKMKCALVGVWAGPGAGPQWPVVGVLPNFTHTISCDDAVPTPIGDMYSQLTFDTSGSFTGYDGATTFSFLEHSSARADSGRGVFANTTGGALEIEGTLNVATGSIDMSFTGEICRAY